MNDIKAIAIDDEEINLLILEEVAKTAGIKILSFIDPAEAVEYIKKNYIDLVFTDYLMPGINGIELIKIIRVHHPAVPIIMLTSVSDHTDIKLMAIQAGATEFLAKPINPPEFAARTKNLIELRKIQLMLMDRAKLLEEEVRKATENIVQREIETLTVMGKAAEFRDLETSNHIIRVSHTSKLIAEAIGLDIEQQELIFYASPLHDLGKLGIPDSILNNPGKLTNEEFIKMQEHSVIGYNILKGCKSKYLQAGAIIALTHHEKYSGEGYPQSLKGNEIPLFGRVVGLADVYDAMISKRRYKEPMPHDKILEVFISEKEKQFDPEIVDAFLSISDTINNLYSQFKD